MSGKKLALIIITTVIVLVIVITAALVWSFMSKLESLVIGSDDDEDLQTYKRELIEEIKVLKRYNDRCNMIQSQEEYDALFLEFRTAGSHDGNGTFGGLLQSRYVINDQAQPLLQEAMIEIEQFHTCMVIKGVPYAVADSLTGDE